MSIEELVPFREENVRSPKRYLVQFFASGEIIKFEMRESRKFTLRKNLSRNAKDSEIYQMEYELKSLSKQLCKAHRIVKKFPEAPREIIDQCKGILDEFYKEYSTACRIYKIQRRISPKDVKEYVSKTCERM